ncbi:hypothetical protein [Fusibacter ferrireducens]|uniref:NEAT domain-containing protein n=1 Tax=Fusibacter ferrireducens TaxID=2785058 RepID=A0ABR9ZP23_9FIRM|nr:hypothetical protein [Fusibacter ferrireducens]MBF4691878.1 hypothetical protein [Fusibacter ferrireducens]
MTKLLRKKISMLLMCSLILVFSVAPTFADTADTIVVVEDSFTDTGSLGLGEYINYNLNFESKGTYRVTVWSSASTAAILSDLTDSSFSELNEFDENTTNSFDIVVSADKLNSYELFYICLGRSLDPNKPLVTHDDYTITIEKIE